MQNLLIALQTGMFFSLYGVRSLLVLYMATHLGMGLPVAYALGAVFNSLGELSGLAGAWIADRIFGLRPTILAGSLIAALGYLSLASGIPLLVSLTLAISGYSLIVNNIAALFGQQLQESEKEEKFTTFYMMQNLGSLVSTLLCGWIAEQWGFPPAFIVASLGLGLATSAAFCTKTLRLAQPNSVNTGKPKLLPLSLLILLPMGIWVALANSTLVLPALPVLIIIALALFLRYLTQTMKLSSLMFLLGLVVLFYAAQDQLISSLIVFTENEALRSIRGIQIPSSFIMAVNPFVVLLLGPIAGKMKIQWMWPFFLGAAAFTGIALLTHPPLLLVSFLVAVMSFAEVILGPRVYAALSRAGSEGMTMALLPIGFSLAYLLGGGYSQIIVSYGYGFGYGVIALALLFGALIAFWQRKRSPVSRPGHRAA